jgi:hypothetical protein
VVDKKDPTAEKVIATFKRLKVDKKDLTAEKIIATYKRSKKARPSSLTSLDWEL